MPAARKASRKREKDFRFFMLNIKLYSATRKGPSAYASLIMDTYKHKRRGVINKDRSGVLRTAFPDRSGNSIWGSVCQFLKIDEKNWVNIRNMEIEGQEIPKDKFPGAREVDYIFYPNIHRMAIRKGGDVSLQAVKKFLDTALPQSCEEGEKVEVVIEQSEDVFERILNAKSIRSLEIDITPSNGDMYEDTVRYMDGEIHSMHAGRLKFDVRSHENDDLKPADSAVLSGLIGVAQSNGTVKAKIIDENDKRDTIETAKHPRLFIVKAEVGRDDQLRENLFAKLKGIFRGRSEA